MNYLALTFTADESRNIQLREVVNFLYDLNIVYELSRLAVDPRYEGFRFSQFVYFRDGRPLDDQDRLRLDTLSKESPLKLKVLIPAVPAAIAAMWGLVQIAQVIDHWPLEKRKLELEVRQKELEVRKLERDERSQAELPPIESLNNFQGHLAERHASEYVGATIHRLERSPIRIEDVEIRIVREDD